MILSAIRVIFVLAVLAISFSYATTDEVKYPMLDPQGKPVGLAPDTKAILVIVIPFALAVAVMLLDAAFPRKSLGGISGLFFGLVAGILVAYILGMVVALGASIFLPSPATGAGGPGAQGRAAGAAPTQREGDLALREADLAARNAELARHAAEQAKDRADLAGRTAEQLAARAPESRSEADRRRAAEATAAAGAAAAAHKQAEAAAAQSERSAQAAKSAADAVRMAVAERRGVPVGQARGAGLVTYLTLLVGAFAIYLCVSFVLQTKDDFRFIIPYVEFARERRGARPILLDTSVIIDGRIADIADTQILESRLIVPRFVLEEIQEIADSSDKLKRNRGRRGLDMLNRLRSNEKIAIQLMDIRVQAVEEAPGVDQKLVALALHLDARVVTNDYNLNKICRLKSVDVININDLANALKPVVLPGETVSVKVIKPGEEAGQGVGYLDDGTMVVAEQGRDHIGKEMTIIVTSVLQTSAGRMIFGRPVVGAGAPPRRS